MALEPGFTLGLSVAFCAWSHLLCARVKRSTLEPRRTLDAADSGGPPIPSHHSPFFKIEPEPVIVAATQAMTLSVLELLGTD